MTIIGLFQCDPWCLPTQNWLQVAINDISNCTLFALCLNYPKLRLRRRVGLFNLLLGRFGFFNPRLSSHGITSMSIFMIAN